MLVWEAGCAVCTLSSDHMCTLCILLKTAPALWLGYGEAAWKRRGACEWGQGSWDRHEAEASGSGVDEEGGAAEKVDPSWSGGCLVTTPGAGGHL